MASQIIEENKEEYDWVSLLLGMGHLHMNQMKCLFKILNKIFLEVLGKEVLNFKSSKAYSFFVSTYDTHKSFQVIQILLHGTTSEISYEYLAHCQNNTASITPEGCMEWLVNQENETVAMVNQLILSYIWAIYIQKVGIRHNDHEFLSGGCYKFMAMFFAFNHSIYQEIQYRDLLNFVSYPPAIREVVIPNVSFSRSELKANHQGGDFHLEGKTERHKMIAPKGHITNELWRRLS